MVDNITQTIEKPKVPLIVESVLVRPIEKAIPTETVKPENAVQNIAAINTARESPTEPTIIPVLAKPVNKDEAIAKLSLQSDPFQINEEYKKLLVSN